MGPVRLTLCAGLLVGTLLVPTAEAAKGHTEVSDPAPAALEAPAAPAGPGLAHAVTGLLLAGAAAAAVARRSRRTTADRGRDHHDRS
ncbi:hypothetical protein STXM2123_177 [Streptomyces sp. F-3]|uniref:hypothetical protein n=1 Tax=Streptomyces TaxID=1883 RepID=UPI0007C35878|nr:MULTISPECIES: hypothetical protein [unclassified Streptomyces]MDN5381023.1 hypothetical protein [Streptomyces sp. LB8]GAT79476.1 hypothetical protein STXM2123_177 [Streptomyces sp. F-3]